MPVARLKYFSLLLAAFILIFSIPIHADDNTTIFPLKDVKPGMKGVVYTIFTGDEIEKVDLVVLGVGANALGPKQDIILVQLLGAKVEHTGVVAGMSGSPVYFDGKLAGALSLKLGSFTKEAIGGVTPIENMLDVEKDSAAPAAPALTTSAAISGSAAPRVDVPDDFLRRTSAGSGQFLIPIETPLITSG